MTPRKVKDLERGGEAQSLSQGIELGLSLARRSAAPVVTAPHPAGSGCLVSSGVSLPSASLRGDRRPGLVPTCPVHCKAEAEQGRILCLPHPSALG